jgi:hypothetical protein
LFCVDERCVVRIDGADACVQEDIPCIEPLECVDGRCAMKPLPGERCEPGDSGEAGCIGGWCDGERCQPFRRSGEECAEDDQCAYGACTLSGCACG